MYKYHLEDVEWSEFSIKDIFKTHFGTNGLQTYTGSYIKKELFSESKLPRITVRETNNGIDSFVHSSDKKFRVFENFISVSFLGGVFYHPYKASIDMKVHALIPINFELNRYNAQFLINAVKNNLMYSSYGNQLSSTDLPRVKVMLPLDEEQNPNWLFMEEYIKERENKKRQELKDYHKNRLLDLVINPEVLTDVEWREVFIEEVAEIYSGKDIYEKERTIGDTPYITATANNNGIGYFVGNNNKTLDSECISVNRNGSVGYAFYHCYEALYGNDTRKLKPFRKNKYTALFIAHAITSQKDKYGYGYKMGTGRLKRQKIMLPVYDGEINYEFMENFIKNIEKKQIKNVLKYLDEYIYNV